MSLSKPPSLGHVLASAGLVCVMASAGLAGVLWWKGTREAEKAVALRLGVARERMAELESLTAAGRSLDAPWAALRDLGLSGVTRDEALRQVRDMLRAKGTKAGVRISAIDVQPAEEPAPSDVGCALEIRTRVEGSSADIANWVYLLQTCDEPLLWIDSVTWVSTGDPLHMRCDAVVRTAFVNAPEGS